MPWARRRLGDPNAVFSEEAKTIPHLTRCGVRPGNARRAGRGSPKPSPSSASRISERDRKRAGDLLSGARRSRNGWRAKLRALKVEFRKRMHDSITATGQWLNLLLKGHLSYFAVSAIAQAYGDSSMRYAGFGCVRFGGAEGVPELGEIHPPYRPVLSADQDPAPAAVTPLRRQDPREEPGAIEALAGTCWGGEEQSPSLPRPSARLAWK